MASPNHCKESASVAFGSLNKLSCDPLIALHASWKVLSDKTIFTFRARCFVVQGTHCFIVDVRMDPSALQRFSVAHRTCCPGHKMYFAPRCMFCQTAHINCSTLRKTSWVRWSTCATSHGTSCYCFWRICICPRRCSTVHDTYTSPTRIILSSSKNRLCKGKR